MAKKNLILVVGPALPDVDELHEELGTHDDLLKDAGLCVPRVSPAELFRAGVEIRRTHKAEGLRRKDVEGSWARVVRAAEKTRGDVVLAHDGYAEASAAQIALLLDALASFRVHVVLTPSAGVPGIDDLIEPWTTLVKAHRLHVVTLGPDEGVEALLSQIGELAMAERATQRGRRMERLRKKRGRRVRQQGRLSAA